MEVVIVGGGGHGKDMLHDLRAQGVSAVGYFDIRPDRGSLGNMSDWADETRPYLIGVNDSWVRRDLAQTYAGLGVPYNTGTWIHRLASVGPYTSLGEHTHVNAGATVTRSSLGDFCTVGPGANICGDALIGDDVMIGAGSTICEFARVEDEVTIGAGAVVLPRQRLLSGSTYVGVPAEAI